MIANLKIEHRIARANLGVSDDQCVMEYVARMTDALRTEYPGADVRVNLKSDFYTASQTLVSADLDPEDGDLCDEIRRHVGVVAYYVWDRMQ